MKTIIRKPAIVGYASSKKCDAVSKVANCAIKLKAVSVEERQRLRIPSYQYLLP
ncbi:MAG: hypothetical protein HDS50_03760 [Bacteroides sp.]|nr:hypothetical protein [Bacteroides sp.]